MPAGPWGRVPLGRAGPARRRSRAGRRGPAGGAGRGCPAGCRGCRGCRGRTGPGGAGSRQGRPGWPRLARREGPRRRTGPLGRHEWPEACPVSYRRRRPCRRLRHRTLRRARRQRPRTRRPIRRRRPRTPRSAPCRCRRIPRPRPCRWCRIPCPVLRRRCRIPSPVPRRWARIPGPPPCRRRRSPPPPPRSRTRRPVSPGGPVGRPPRGWPVPARAARPRLQPELLHQQLAAHPVALQRLRLSPRAVQRQHQLPAQPFPQRVDPYQQLDLADQLVVAAEVELQLDPRLGGRQPLLVQLQRLAAQRLARHPAQAVALPQLTRSTQQFHRLRRVPALRQGARVREPAGEDGGVDEVALRPEDVPRRPRGDRGGDSGRREELAQSRHADLHLGACGVRRLVVPDEVDQVVRADDPVRLKEQGGENDLLPPRGIRTGPLRPVTCKGPRMRNTTVSGVCGTPPGETVMSLPAGGTPEIGWSAGSVSPNTSPVVHGVEIAWW